MNDATLRNSPHDARRCLYMLRGALAAPRSRSILFLDFAQCRVPWDKLHNQAKDSAAELHLHNDHAADVRAAYAQ